MAFIYLNQYFLFKQDLNHPVNLVAVSKTQPKNSIIKAYNFGQRCFGENYIQELVEKSQDREVIKIYDYCFIFIFYSYFTSTDT